MSNSQNVSKAEWLCAALIDFLPIAILTKLPIIVYNIAAIVSYCTKDQGNHSWESPSMRENVSIILLCLSALYLLLKDSFGLSLGKRIMGIKLQKEGEDAVMDLCLLRNLVLALFYVHCFIFIIDPGNTNFFLKNLFFFYCIAELICVYFTNRTIGDNICQLQLVKCENYVPSKLNNRTFCIIAIILLFTLVVDSFVPRFYWGDLSAYQYQLLHDHKFIKLYYLSIYLPPALVQSVVYSFLLYKLIKPKAFRWTAIILIVLIKMGITLKLVEAL